MGGHRHAERNPIATIGVILMLAGLAWLVLSLALDFRARREIGGPAVAERERVVERGPAAW